MNAMTDHRDAIVRALRDHADVIDHYEDVTPEERLALVDVVGRLCAERYANVLDALADL